MNNQAWENSAEDLKMDDDEIHSTRSMQIADRKHLSQRTPPDRHILNSQLQQHSNSGTQITFTKNRSDKKHTAVPKFEETEAQPIQKYEYFNQQSLLLCMELTKTEAFKNNPKTQGLYKKLEEYYYASEFSSCRTRVIYKHSKKQQQLQEEANGRIYPWVQSLYHAKRTSMAGLQTFPRWVRAALASELYFDVDIVNAHSSILLSVLKLLFPAQPGSKKTQDWRNLEFYYQNRELVLENTGLFLGEGSIYESAQARKEAKTFLTTLLYGCRIPAKAGYEPRYKFIAPNLFHLEHFVDEMEEASTKLYGLCCISA